LEVQKQVIFPGIISIIIFTILFLILRDFYQEQHSVTKQEIQGIQSSSIYGNEDEMFSLFLEPQRDEALLISIITSTIPQALKNIHQLKNIQHEHYIFIAQNNKKEFLQNLNKISEILIKIKNIDIDKLDKGVKNLIEEFALLQNTTNEYDLMLSKIENSLSKLHQETKDLLLERLYTREGVIADKLYYGTLLYFIIILLTILVMQRNFYKSSKLLRAVDKKKNDDKYVATLKETLLASSSFKHLCEISIYQLVKKFDAVSGILYIYDDNNYKLYLGGTFGIDSASIDATVSIHDNLIGDCIIDHQYKITHSNIELINGADRVQVQELVSIPLVSLGKSIGAVQLYFSDCFDYCEMDFLKRVIYIMSNYIYQSEKDNQTAHYLQLIDKNIMVIKTDLNGDIIDVSEEFCNLSGFSKEELVGNNHRIFRHKDTSHSLYIKLWDTIKKGLVWRGEIKNKTKTGGYYWADNIIAPNFDLNGNIIGYTGIKHDITNKKLVEELSITDALTKLYNRRYFDEVFLKQLLIAQREKKQIALAIIDIDYFKQYNDTYGHQEGDKALIAVSKTIKSLMYRPNDYCFRIGGEEFAMLYHYKIKENAIKFSNKIRQAVENLKILHRNHYSSKHLTISIGVKLLEGAELENANNAFREADKALYEAKNAGRNRVVALGTSSQDL